MKLFLLLLSLVSINVYSMKRGHAKEKQSDNSYIQQGTVIHSNDTKEDIKRKKVEKSSNIGTIETQSTSIYDTSLSTKLIKAVEEGNEDHVKQLLQAAADPHAIDSENIPGLCIAAVKGYKALVEMLIAHGADINAQDSDGNTALCTAAKNGHKEIVRVFLDKGANSHLTCRVGDITGITALICAAELGYKEIVEMLIAHGADVNAQNSYGYPVLCGAVFEGHKEIVKILLENKVNPNLTFKDSQGVTGTTLMGAASRGHKAIVELLIAYGADVNAQASNGYTALMCAAIMGHKEIVQLLLNKGANPLTCEHSEGIGGTTSLMLAAKNGYTEIVELLVDADNNINAQQSDGITVLHWAINEHTNTNLVKILLAKGANPHLTYRDSEGIKDVTPLMDAAFYGNKEVVQMLLDFKSNINAYDSTYDTALMLAARRGHKAVVALLLARGADISASNRQGQTALNFAIRNRHKETVELLLAHNVDHPHNIKAAIADAIATSVEMLVLLLKLPVDCSKNIWGYVYDDLPVPEECRFMVGLYLKLGAYNWTVNADSYAQAHRMTFLEKKIFLRVCELSNSIDYLLTKEHTHDRCTHQTVLMWCCIFGREEAVKELLKVELPLWYLNAQDYRGKTALMYAIIIGHYDIVQLLTQVYEQHIKKLAEKVQDTQNDPILQNSLLQQLKKAKRAICISDRGGKSVLDYAVLQNNTIIVLRLLEAGARPSLNTIKEIVDRDKKDHLLQLIVRGFILSSIT